MFPRWLSWMFLLTMGYVIFSASQGGNPVAAPASSSVVPPITKETYPALAATTDIERWKRKLNPDYASTTNCSLDDLTPPEGLGLKVIIDQAGEGAAAACGETLRIQLTIWSPTGAVAYAGELPLDLGARELAAGVDAGLVGIMKGETRTLVIPPYALVHSNSSKAPAAASKALVPNHVTTVSVTRL